MTRQLLPDDTQPTPVKRNNKPLLWLLVLLLLVSLVGVVSIIGFQPGILGLMRSSDFSLTSLAVEGTSTALESTASALESTGQFLVGREIEFQSTQAALANAANQIIQTETQQRVNADTTQTAIAVSNAQQATQAAVNFANTQTALDATGTQVQLDYQSTREALNRLLTASPPATTQSSIFVLNDNFASGTETSINMQLPPSGIWAIRGDGTLVAQRDNATIITARRDLTNYTLVLDLTPTKAGNVDILLNVMGSNAPLVLRLNYDGSQLVSAYVTPFNFDTLGNGVVPDTSPTFGAAEPLEMRADPLSLQVTVRDNVYRVTLNSQSLFEFVYPAGGSVGVQVPAGTLIQRFNVD